MEKVLCTRIFPIHFIMEKFAGMEKYTKVNMSHLFLRNFSILYKKSLLGEATILNIKHIYQYLRLKLNVMNAVALPHGKRKRVTGMVIAIIIKNAIKKFGLDKKQLKINYSRFLKNFLQKMSKC
ncbi:MAG: hypothetical protein HGA61_00665 [Candidatus Moranbacteria bacterium]|nr:hypothetical protein [Candidatus Moranbacteria bacterium]